MGRVGRSRGVVVPGSHPDRAWNAAHESGEGHSPTSMSASPPMSRRALPLVLRVGRLWRDARCLRRWLGIALRGCLDALPSFLAR